MNDLPMPSDVKEEQGKASPAASQPAGGPSADPVLAEPPSVKLIVRLFLIPLVIVAAAVGVMFLIGLLAGGTPTMDEALARLKNPGGERTVDWLVGPGSKQRYMDAKTLTDKMKSGMTEPERIKLADDLIEILDKYTKPTEGEVQHFLLLALGRTWQRNPAAEPIASLAADESRKKVVAALLRYAQAEPVQTRKAAVLSLAYLAGQPEVRDAIPTLVAIVRDEKEDLDVRLAAVTVLGPIASPSDPQVIDALQFAMRDTDPRNAELVWGAALSLAQLQQTDVSDTILKLLDRSELAKMEYYDRESDPRNPSFRQLNDQEQQRILINTMIGARNLHVPAVQDRLKQLSESDPSPRVREAGLEVLKKK